MGPLKEAVIEIWDASGRRFGFRKVWPELAGDPRYGPFAGTTPCRVRKCMSEDAAGAAFNGLSKQELIAGAIAFAADGFSRLEEQAAKTMVSREYVLQRINPTFQAVSTLLPEAQL
jgi:hypothetical protein